MMFEALGKLNKTRSESLALDILTKESVFRSDAMEQTRAVAAEYLSGSDSKEILDALEKVAKKKLFTSASVRQAATKAAEMVQQRRSSLPPKGTP
jgi:hypothetical protein